MTTCLGKELFIRFTASAFRKLLPIYVFRYFPFGFEGKMWDLIASVPDHCLSFYFTALQAGLNSDKKKTIHCHFMIVTNTNHWQMIIQNNT